ncbi:hypothetical protein [Azohydromonas caseinilytica]|uniref:Protein kinase domain-containing protein n=1 Tax=Azohydromonas caseinilytica TaxID=2728836 RepID=A0A848FAX8_9BURK|nr:hypothetical protein [Azohydromonas caseinilytica]NML15360.1 hypothetical protein [Azohydromonas caseinilytica]
MTPPDAPTSPAARAVGSSLAGCTIEAVLHAGPVCTVYRVRDGAGPPGAGRFALKEYAPQALCERDQAGLPRLRQPDDPAAQAAFDAGRTAFVEELRMLSRLHLPGLVPVLQIREDHDGPCGLMPLLPGGPLQRLPIPQSDDALHAQLLALLEPLAQLHAVGVVHGALHGRQLLWAPRQAPVLLGFSLAARALGRPREGASPPEAGAQSAHLPQGPWSDLYALAAMVLGQLSGQAWSGAPTAAGVGAVLEQALGPTPETAKRHVLVKALQSCLLPSPSERPPHAGALRELLGGGPARASHAAPSQPHPHSHPHPDPQSHPQQPGAGAPEHAAAAARTAPGAAPGGVPVRTPGAGHGVPAAVRSAGFVMPALPPRRSDNRRMVMVSLLLAVGCGVTGWWARDLWQQERERHRVDHLLVTAAAQAPAQPGWTSAAAALPALDDAVAARVAAAEAAATAALQATAARTQAVAAELPAQADAPEPQAAQTLAEAPSQPQSSGPATPPATQPAIAGVVAPAVGPATAPVQTVAAPQATEQPPLKVAAARQKAATPSDIPAQSGAAPQAAQEPAVQVAAAPNPPAPVAAPLQAAVEQGAVHEARDKPAPDVAVAPARPAPERAVAGEGAARQAPDKAAVKGAAAPAAAERPAAKAPPRPSAKPAPAPVRTAKAPGPAPARSGPPRNACASLTKYALLQCMQRQCSQAAARRHPQCQRLLNDNVLSS